MKKRYAMAVDTRRCVACNACVIACKTENRVPDGGFRCWTVQETSGTFPELALEVRSERFGSNPRYYTITYTARDGGGSTTKTETIRVGPNND